MSEGASDDEVIHEIHAMLKSQLARDDLLGDLANFEGNPRDGRRPIYLTAGELMALLQLLGRLDRWVRPTHPLLADTAQLLMNTLMKRGGESHFHTEGEDPPADYGA